MRPVSSHLLNLLIVDPQELGVERAERERVERERVERVEQERNERERMEQGRLERERVERERLERERAERERLERERVEQERTEQEREVQEGVVQEFLFRRLKPVETGYHRKLCCMDGTRQSLLNHIVEWVANKTGQGNAPQKNTYWFYGSPGIGKTSLAHSICASLHERNHLAGAFFCRRDDPNLSEPINILPTFIHKLAIIFPPFRIIVAKHLRSDPNLTPESMKGSLFLDFIRSLPRHPEHTLVFVVDALDECGDAQSRPRLLKVLTNAAAQAPWLKIIITSRTEVDIQHFFDTLTQSSYSSYNLATDQDTSADLYHRHSGHGVPILQAATRGASIGVQSPQANRQVYPLAGLPLPAPLPSQTEPWATRNPSPITSHPGSEVVVNGIKTSPINNQATQVRLPIPAPALDELNLSQDEVNVWYVLCSTSVQYLSTAFQYARLACPREAISNGGGKRNHTASQDPCCSRCNPRATSKAATWRMQWNQDSCNRLCEEFG